ncbi:hypothetical protein B0H10DRAFT_2201342 [Mycena sp. CBHHK59/15]|nr:hypothetical protein B0H10DRAFT_2201342 [Mycena sp. CBHHK59/15]
MAPNTWATADQIVWLKERQPAYLEAQSKKQLRSMTRFWNKLEHNWFEAFPEEKALGLPMPGPDVLYMPEELKLLGDSINLRKLRLKRVMRYQARRVTQRLAAGRAAASLANALFSASKIPKRKQRKLQVIEVYQRVKKDEIKVLLDRAGYNQINEEVQSAATAEAVGSGEVPDAVTMEEVDVRARERIASARSARMRMMRQVTQASWNNETEEVKLEFQQSTREANEERAGPAIDEQMLDDLTPDELQENINIGDEVAQRFLEVFGAMTGMYGVLIYGGPVPEREGQVTLKTVSYGTTPKGATIEASHPDWDGQVAAPIAKFFKRAFPHDIRDARALHRPQGPNADLDGLIPMPSDDADEDVEPAPAQPAKAKRIRRPKPKNMGSSVPTAANTSMATSAPVTTTANASMVPLAPVRSPTPQPTMSTNHAMATKDRDVATPPNSAQDSADPASCSELGMDSSGPASDFDLWDGMPPPTSPGTAATIASYERGVLVDMGNIDPALYGGQAPASQISRGGPRPIYRSATFSMDREIGGSPGRRPCMATEVSGLRFPSSSLYRPSTLFDAFRNGPIPPSSSAPSTLSSSGHFVFEQGARSPTSSTISSPAASSPTPAPRRPLALAAFKSAMGAPSMSSPPQAVVPALSRPFAAPPVLVTSVEGVPATHATTTAPINAIVPSPPTVPADSAIAPAVVPAQALQFIQSRPMANPPKGHPSTTVAKALAPPKVTKRGKACAPQMTEAARIVTAQIRKEEAAQRRERARVLAIVAEQEKAAKRLQPNLHNLDGNSDLYVTRPKRNAAAPLNPDGTPFELPKKLTRAEMAARKNAASENALLEQVKKRAAEAPAGNAAKKRRRA